MAPVLVEKGYQVVGYDIGYYEDCYLKAAPQDLKRQIKKVVRDCEVSDFEGIDAVIHLAGLSNDPLGELNPNLTEEINFKGTMKLAECAKKAGVKRFAYASSQSIYGISDTSKEATEEDPKNPLTAYAITKWKSECELRKLADENFYPVFMRPATAYGASPNLRCDIVFNAFMGYAYTSGKIEVKSDGTPWRPMAHIRDIIAAFIAAVEAPKELVYNQAFNVGTDSNNYTVRDIAEAAKNIVPGSSLIFTGEHTDSRSYRVSFNKLLTVLADYYKPEWDLEKGAADLLKLFDEIGFTREIFDSWKCTRLKCLKKKLDEGVVDGELRMS